jgi:hypothetical protein
MIKCFVHVCPITTLISWSTGMYIYRKILIEVSHFSRAGIHMGAPPVSTLITRHLLCFYGIRLRGKAFC